ncbi:MAG: hypothetical protein ACON4B_06830 [Flavobacteriaceae bacterium]
MSTNNTTPPSEEVDLGQLFKMIGNAFSRLFNFVGSIFKQLFLAFVWVVFFFKKRALILGSALVAGLILGVVLEQTTPPSYKSRITLKQNYPTGENLYGSVDYYNGLIRDKDYNILSQILGLNQVTTETITGFEIEPVLTENDKLIMFDQYIRGLDSLAASKIEYEDYVDNIEAYKHAMQRISIFSENRVNFKNVFDNIIDNINTNPFFVNERDKELTQLNQQKAALERSLAQSDSLQNTYKRVLEQQMDNKTSSEIGITFEGNNDKNKTREYDLYKNDVELRREIVKIDRRLKDRANIVEIISSKQDNGFIDKGKELLGVTTPTKLYYTIVFTLFSLIILLGLEFFRFLERYKPE